MGKEKAVPQVLGSNADPDSNTVQQFELELHWCIQQLETALATNKMAPKQGICLHMSSKIILCFSNFLKNSWLSSNSVQWMAQSLNKLHNSFLSVSTQKQCLWPTYINGWETCVYSPPSSKHCIGIMYCVSLVMSRVYIILTGACVELLTTILLGWWELRNWHLYLSTTAPCIPSTECGNNLNECSKFMNWVSTVAYNVATSHKQPDTGQIAYFWW